MACFSVIFGNCCIRLRNRGSNVRRSVAGRKPSTTSSGSGGGCRTSTRSSPRAADCSSTNSSRSRHHESNRPSDEDEALLSSSPQNETVSYGARYAHEREKREVPLISVLKSSEDTSEEPTAEIIENQIAKIEDSNLEKVSACSSRSQKSLQLLEEQAENETIKTERRERNSLVSEDNDDVDQLPAYQSRSELSVSTQRVQDVSLADVNGSSADDEHFDENVKISGDIVFGLNYNYKKGVLEVHVKECRNLSALDTKKNRSDPYVKAYLLPDRSKTGKRKTKVKKHTLNPVFDETLKFPVSVSELERRTLWLSVWHSQFGKNGFLGEIMFPLEHGTVENHGYKSLALKNRKETNNYFLKYNGDIELVLKFVPCHTVSPQNQERPNDTTKGNLHVLVKEAKNLIPTFSNGTSNPFCKSYLLPEKSKGSKQKSAVAKKTCNPKWNHTFIYSDVTLSDLKERCLELTIWNHDKISSNNFLGGVRLSLGKGKYQGCDVEWMYSVTEEVNLWETLLCNPGMCAEGTLLLRSQMQNR